MGDQRVHQGAGLVAGGGMHDEAFGLVDDDDVVVLIDDIERDIFTGPGSAGAASGTSIVIVSPAAT